MTRWAFLAATLVLPLDALAETPPSNQNLVFYNARIALREERPVDVLKLWLLRNGLTQRGESSEHDANFRSLVWASLGSLGFCQDGFPKDDQGGAGLWPIALHNWVVLSLSRGPPLPQPPPFDVFQAGRQQRFISLQDVLSAEELRSVEFFRTGCILPRVTLMDVGEVPWADLSDRLNAGMAMRHLLELSKQTLAKEKVQNLAAIEARIFDLDLALAALHSRRARGAARSAAQDARSLGVSKSGAEDLREAASRWPANSRQAEFLRKTLRWSASEWLTLSRDRRLFLYDQARTVAKSPDSLSPLVLSIIDELIETKQGEELQGWIGSLDAAGSQKLRAEVTSGERGRRLLELEPDTGFRERSTVALHRGVAFLEAGDLRESLRSFAYAMKHAEHSREAEVSLSLSRRWLSYVLSRYETTHAIIGTLKELVPRQEYNAVIEDLLWRAALRADARSFDRITKSVKRGGALDARIERLEPLSNGKPGAMATTLRGELEESPYAVLSFVRQLVERLESEDGEVRALNIPTMKLLNRLLEPMIVTSGKQNAHSRTADELLRRTQGILDGLDQLDVTEAGKARALSPAHETFAGAIRLAPSDALPWPFLAPQPEAPSAFTPFVLIPLEWRDAAGKRVFGWRITE